MKKLLITGITTMTLCSTMFGLSYHKSHTLPQEIDFEDYKSSIRNICIGRHIPEHIINQFSDEGFLSDDFTIQF